MGSPVSISMCIYLAVLLDLRDRRILPDAHHVCRWTMFATGIANDASRVVRVNVAKVTRWTRIPRRRHRPIGGVHLERVTERFCMK